MALEESDADMYTDDFTLTAQAKPVSDLEKKLTTDSHKISEKRLLMQPKQKSYLLQPG